MDGDEASDVDEEDESNGGALVGYNDENDDPKRTISPETYPTHHYTNATFVTPRTSQRPSDPGCRSWFRPCD